jgi:hypothetical protein
MNIQGPILHCGNSIPQPTSCSTPNPLTAPHGADLPLAAVLQGVFFFFFFFFFFLDSVERNIDGSHQTPPHLAPMINQTGVLFAVSHMYAQFFLQVFIATRHKIKRNNRIWDFHGGGDSSLVLLGCDAV